MKMSGLLAWLLVWIVAILCSVGIWRDLLRFSRISPDSAWHLRAHSARLRDFCSRKIAEPAAAFAVFGLILLWSLTVKPNNDCPGPPDVAERPGQKSMVMKSL